MPIDTDIPRLAERPHVKALSSEEAFNFFGITAKQWQVLKRDVLRGSKRFWEKRGMVEPGGFREAIREDAVAGKARAAGRTCEQAVDVNNERDDQDA